MTYAQHKNLEIFTPGKDEKYFQTPFISTSANKQYLLNYARRNENGKPENRYLYRISTRGIKQNFFAASKQLSDQFDAETLAEMKEYGTNKKIPWKNVMDWWVIKPDGSVTYVPKSDSIQWPGTAGRRVHGQYRPKTRPSQ
ncbi:hypothetical protein MCOR25_007571 [Pyricularia grisea]|uniref:Uncharacterized protein n=1 Tax=Pyricularia grisea TaxID=148305 RepID=A0A6P8BJK6_PYRGI|nr:uncharacterized protein PgNI_00076 [Pyricularia grisea]KAI6357737.1 hypothetical protein MCOR25_007571 [Pyricularia grisea]TLD17081.1 hypothetical protein PgNI_00076 [Pyricularia grisea]